MSDSAVNVVQDVSYLGVELSDSEFEALVRILAKELQRDGLAEVAGQLTYVELIRRTPGPARESLPTRLRLLSFWALGLFVLLCFGLGLASILRAVHSLGR